MTRRFAFVVTVDADGDHPEAAAIAERSLRLLLAGHTHGLNEPLPTAPDQLGCVPAGVALRIVGLTETRPS